MTSSAHRVLLAPHKAEDNALVIVTVDADITTLIVTTNQRQPSSIVLAKHQTETTSVAEEEK